MDGGCTPSSLRVGLAVGAGTGPELADVFQKVLRELGSLRHVHLDIVQSQRRYHSYLTLLDASPDHKSVIAKESMKDAIHYLQFCQDEVSHGTKAIFRTSISAQALYEVRQQLQAVKVEVFNQARAESSLLIIRDQCQGFYAGISSYDNDTETITRKCLFSKKIMRRIVTYSISRARREWNGNSIDSVILVYKHHLFDGMLDIWAQEWSKEHEIELKLLQPDTMNRNILAFGLQGRQLVIASNEYFDIMQPILLNMFGGEAQETSCSENVYLRQDMLNLSEFQTVHGSADDIVGTGTVNPTATIKAAAAILERYCGCEGMILDVNKIIHMLAREKAVTPDQGGCLSTSEYVDAFLRQVRLYLQPSTNATQRLRLLSNQISPAGDNK